MNTALTRLMRLALWLTLPLSVWAQTPPAASTLPVDAAAVGASVAPVQASPAPTPVAPPAAPPEGCRPLTDKAIAADMKAVTAQSQKLDLAEQLRLFEAAASLWSQAEAQCEGRAKDRAQRNLADSRKASASISEQLGSGPQCAAAHKDAGALQDMARQALSERRWTDASLLFRKSENMWDVASERCTGSQQEIANRRRGESEIDGHNAEYCAPLFEKAREHTQKLRAAAAGLSREDKQDASMVAETLWRDALGQCKGAAVQDSARNNAQALARERGTPWVARVAPAPQPTQNPATPMAVPSTLSQPTDTGAATSGGVIAKLTSVFSSLGNAVTPAVAAAAVATAVTATPIPKLPEVQPPEFTAGTTRFSGQFVRDTDGTSYSGTGKLVWANGDAFDGTLVKGRRHGKGVFNWANGQRYSGDWVNDKPVGQASVQFSNGNQYEGGVSDGRPQGQGRMRFASGDTYTGQFKDGGPDGSGLYVWKNGQQFDGEWKNEQPNGQGKLKFSTGNQYQGAVVGGVPNGQGRMVFATGETYVGHFANGDPDGQGVFNWTNGDKYTGQWKAGKKHGQGAFTWKSGDLWEGMYENDEQTVRSKN